MQVSDAAAGFHQGFMFSYCVAVMLHTFQLTTRHDFFFSKTYWIYHLIAGWIWRKYSVLPACSSMQTRQFRQSNSPTMRIIIRTARPLQFTSLSRWYIEGWKYCSNPRLVDPRVKLRHCCRTFVMRFELFFGDRFYLRRLAFYRFIYPILKKTPKILTKYLSLSLDSRPNVV